MKLRDLIDRLQQLEHEGYPDEQVVSVQMAPGSGPHDERVVVDRFTATGTPCVSIVLMDKEIG